MTLLLQERKDSTVLKVRLYVSSFLAKSSSLEQQYQPAAFKGAAALTKKIFRGSTQIAPTTGHCAGLAAAAAAENQQHTLSGTEWSRRCLVANLSVFDGF